MEMDVAAAEADENGDRSRARAWKPMGTAWPRLLKIGSQVWYGTGAGGDADGFPGAVQIVDGNYR
jgi:hypothetical protein